MSRQRVIHVVALVALIISLAYLTWRVGFTIGASLLTSIPLWLLEVHAVVGLALFTSYFWDPDSSVVPAPVTETNLRVAVLITTYDEPKSGVASWSVTGALS